MTTTGPVTAAASDGLVARAARAILAPVVGGVVGAVVFLIMVQGSFRQGHTTLDFNHVLGTLIEGEAEERGSTSEALGVIGDSVGPTGLYATFVAGIALMAVYSLVIVPLVRWGWIARAIPLGIITFLALGLVYAPIADARLDTPVGLFGSESGDMTPLVLFLCAMGFAVIGARCHSVVSKPAFWMPHHHGLDKPLEAAAGLDDRSLELPEERPEEGRVGP